MVYLIHFFAPLAHAKHYLGYTSKKKMADRIARHKSGTGAAILRELKRRGIEWEVVRTWPDGDRTFERRLKNQKNSKKHCPICRGLISKSAILYPQKQVKAGYQDTK